MFNYGANAARNFREVSVRNPYQAAQTTVNYARRPKTRHKDSFNYAKQEIRQLDHNRDGKLSFRELRSAYGSAPKAASVLRAADLNRDGRLDAEESALLLQFQDGIGRRDGKVTPFERQQAFRAIQGNPDAVNQQLHELRNVNEMSGRYQRARNRAL